MSQIHDTLTAISQMSPAEFKQMAVLAESIVKYNVLFIAWLNSMRRRSRHELQGLWKARHGDIMVRLTADVMQLARNTGAVSTKALEALQENPVLWGLENTEAHARFNRMWRILVAL